MSALVAQKPMPGNIAVLLIAILTLGFTAAQVVSPVMWWTTFAMVGIVVIGWKKAQAREVDPDTDPAELPARTRRIVTETFAELRDGSESESLLRGVIQPARTLYAAAASNESFSGPLLRDCAELVEVSCATAEELDRVDALLGGKGAKALSSDSVHQSLHQTRDLFRRRLGDAADALSQLYVQSVQKGTMSSDRVAELATELSAEVSVRKRVSAEMKALLE